MFSNRCKQLALLVVLAIFGGAIGHRSLARDEADWAPELTASPESLVAKINSVTVLEITTDRPITQYRLVVNSEVKGEHLTNEPASEHLYLAVVPGLPPISQRANIHMKIGHANSMLSHPFNMWAEKNIQRTIEYMPPKKKVTIGDWTTVYGLTIMELGKVARCIEVQISGAKPDAPSDADKLGPDR